MEFNLALFTAFFPLIISTLAFGLSVITFYLNRKRITVSIPKEYDALGDWSIYNYTDNGKSFGYGPGIKFPIEIINTSPCDISYFDLKAINRDHPKEKLYLLTRTAIDEESVDKKFYQANPLKPDSPFHVSIPPSVNGVLKAHSYNKFDIYIIPNQAIENVRFSFKVTIRRKPFSPKDPYSDIKAHRKLKYYFCDYNLKDWENKSISPSLLPTDEYLKLLRK